MERNIAKERMIKQIKRKLDAPDKWKAIRELDEIIENFSKPTWLEILGYEISAEYREDKKDIETLARQVKTQLLLEGK